MPQWSILDRMEDAATQRLDCEYKSPNLELKTWFLAWSENSHKLTTTTTGSKNSQKEVNNQIDNQNQCSVPPPPPKVPSVQALGFV